jgi:hypothetical protein
VLFLDVTLIAVPKLPHPVYFSVVMKSTKREKKPGPDVSADLKKLGERIKALRIAKGYTSHEIFAWEHKINRTQYGRYERGEDLRYSSLVKIIKALNMTVEEFFGEGFKEK